MALSDEQPSMDDTAAIGGAADIGGLAAGGQDSRISPTAGISWAEILRCGEALT